MVASSWYSDGILNTYDPATAAFGPVTHLATNAAVDAQAVTRLQYTIGGGGLFSALGNSLTGYARIRVSRDDYDWAKNPANAGGGATTEIRAFMHVAPASGLPANPTISQIYFASLASGLIFQSTEAAPAPPVGGTVDKEFYIIGPHVTKLSPNTKYWVAMVPGSIKPGEELKYRRLLHTVSTTGTDISRAVSFWTNRTPAAPVITSPVTNVLVPSGSLINLSIAPGDPDGMFGGTSPQYTDVAGTHVQYAPRPTPENPNPEWVDLPFTTTGGVITNKGWWIKGSNANVAGDGASALATSGTIPIRCGAATGTAGAGLLPSGTWQVRVRTFDFGHQTPNVNNPLGDYATGGAYSPANYPAANTSPWSPPVIITVSAQVPSPVPLFPVGNVAVTEGTTVNLAWQYRNTAVPPYPQAKRSVRIRKVGDTAWTNLAVLASSASSSMPVTGFSLVSGNQYEWQVLVVDSSGVSSSWGDIARFWVVPAPASGEERPLPSTTIDGATLGCGNNRIFVYRRGGQERVAELRGIASVEWNRLRDDISDARIIVSGWGEDCGNLLAQLQPWAYEIVIVRENGYSTDRVWEGPITLITYDEGNGTVEIDAKDVMAYVYRRIIRQIMDDSADGATVVSRAARIIQNALAPDDPNLLGYLTILNREDDAMQYRNTPAYSRTAFEEIDDMAANSGLDYAAVGRAIMVWGTKHRIGTLPEFQNKDLGSAPIVSVYGMSTATAYVVSDGNGVYGMADRLDENGKNETYGLVEMLSSSWASDSAPEEGTYTQEGLEKVRASFAESAERSISSRYPPPVVVRVPDNTTINPDATISIQQLVPGVVIPLRSVGLRTVVADQKLDAIKVTQTGADETISLTLSPFNNEDTEAEEE